jgi:hypothetical protein
LATNMKEKGDSKYKRLIQTLLRTIGRVLPTYSGKFSKRTYTQHQHATAVCLMKYENKPYRDVVELLVEFADYFKFGKTIPHFTTLQKFFKRIPSFVWDFVLTKTFRLISKERAVNVAIDSTGYKDRHTSSYYAWRIVGRGIEKTPHRRFMKNSIAVDTDRQAIIAERIHKSGVPDMVDFVPLLGKTAKVVKINNVTADKGYDSEANHRFAREEIGAFSIIPPKTWDPGYKTHGKYRKQLRRNFPSKLYHRRNMIETVNSVQKRKFGDELRSRLWYMRKKEMKVINVVYNVYRCMKIGFYVVVGGFLHTETTSIFINGEKHTALR